MLHAMITTHYKNMQYLVWRQKNSRKPKYCIFCLESFSPTSCCSLRQKRRVRSVDLWSRVVCEFWWVGHNAPAAWAVLMDGLFSVGWAFQLIMLFSLRIAEIISILLTVVQKAARHAPSSPGKINVFFCCYLLCKNMYLLLEGKSQR